MMSKCVYICLAGVLLFVVKSIYDCYFLLSVLYAFTSFTGSITEGSQITDENVLCVSGKEKSRSSLKTPNPSCKQNATRISLKNNNNKHNNINASLLVRHMNSAPCMWAAFHLTMSCIYQRHLFCPGEWGCMWPQEVSPYDWGPLPVFPLGHAWCSSWAVWFHASWCQDYLGPLHLPCLSQDWVFDLIHLHFLQCRTQQPSESWCSWQVHLASQPLLSS
jgi:hypothetical protein